MNSLRTLAIASTLATFCVTGYAQTPAEHDSHHPDAVATEGMSMPMGDAHAKKDRMAEQMKAMHAMHNKMMQAKTPKARNALMAEHMKVMQDGMSMMDEMGSGGMMGKGGMKGMMGKEGMGGMKDKPTMGTDKGGMSNMQGKKPMKSEMAAHHQMMEKRMLMMQSMMQMMMDRMSPAPG